MKINFVKIDSKIFKFDKKSNLITSSVNSVGKTTLIRSILYGLGYQIAFTRGFSFDQIEVEIVTNDNVINIYRSNDKQNTIKIIFNKKYTRYFDPTSEQVKILSIVYDIEDPDILTNILGLHYFDQDKGWTLLNRGRVIGDVRFSIENYIEGIGHKKINDINEDIKEIKNKKAIYRQIGKIIQNRDEYEQHDDINWNQIDEVNNSVRSIEMKIRRIKTKNERLKELRYDNQSLVDFILSSNMYIKTKHGKEKITEDNLIFTEYKINDEMLNAQIANNNQKRSSLLKRKRKIQNKLNETLQLISVDDQIGRFGNAVSNLNISADNIKNILKDYNKNLKRMKQKRKNILQDNNVTGDIYKTIISFSQILGVEKSIDKNKDFIFTSDLKQYSGAKLHLLVFAFRMALLRELQLVTGTTLPIILDSPVTGELDSDNLKKIFNLLKKYFSDNQVIVASIISDDNYYNYKFNNKITLIHRLMD